MIQAILVQGGDLKRWLFVAHPQCDVMVPTLIAN